MRYEALKSAFNNNGTNDTNNSNNDSTTNIGGPLTALITKIIDNLQFVVEGVHIRYEDTRNNNCFSVGLTIEHLSVQSTDNKWSPTFLTATHSLIHKLISLKNLTVYWNSNDKPIDNSEIESLLNKLLYSDQYKPLHQYLLNPINGNLKLTINKNQIREKQQPKYNFNFQFEDIGITCNEIQYKQISDLLEWFTIYNKGYKYRKLRPLVRPHDSNTCKLWWYFAVDCVTSNIRDRKAKWSPSYLSKRREIRLEYISIFKKKRIYNHLSHQDSLRLNTLERILSYDDIILYVFIILLFFFFTYLLL